MKKRRIALELLSMTAVITIGVIAATIFNKPARSGAGDVPGSLGEDVSVGTTLATNIYIHIFIGACLQLNSLFGYYDRQQEIKALQARDSANKEPSGTSSLLEDELTAAETKRLKPQPDEFQSLAPTLAITAALVFYGAIPFFMLTNQFTEGTATALVTKPLGGVTSDPALSSKSICFKGTMYAGSAVFLLAVAFTTYYNSGPTLLYLKQAFEAFRWDQNKTFREYGQHALIATSQAGQWVGNSFPMVISLQMALRFILTNKTDNGICSLAFVNALHCKVHGYKVGDKARSSSSVNGSR